MTQVSPKTLPFHTINRKLLQIGILLLTAGLSFSALVLPIATRPSYYPIKVGDVAPQDIQAPNSLNYVSQVQTEQMRADAEQRVMPVYLPADPAIARQQIEILRATLNFVVASRSDSYSTLEQKLEDLSA